MRKLIIWALLLASAAQAQTLKFGEGESYKPAIKITGLPDTITRVEISLKTDNNLLVRKFSTVGGSITRVSDSLFTFSFTDQMTIGKSGKGTWQVEIQTPSLGVRKSRIFPYEITKSTTNRGTETGVGASGYSQLFHWNFTPTVPTFTVLESGFVLVNGQSIAATISDSLDAIRELIGEGGGTDIDTTKYLQKTTAAGLYVAKESGKSLMTDAERTKLSGIAVGATANSTDVQLRDRTTHTGVQGISTITALQDSLTKKVNTTDARLSDARTPVTHSHSQSDITGLASALDTKQATLVSGTNIKTVNGASVLGSGNITAGDATLAGTQTFTGVNTFSGNILGAGKWLLGPTSSAALRMEISPNTTSYAESDALLAIRVAATAGNNTQNAIEWGHTSSGFLSVLGVENNSGDQVIVMGGQVSSTPNLYRTRGMAAQVIKSHATGGHLSFSRATNAFADNQSLTESMRLTGGGTLIVGGTTDNGLGKAIVYGNLSLGTAGNKINIATGSNASVGTATLVSGTVTVSTTAVTANSIIIVTSQSGSTVASYRISARTAGTSFVITSSSAGDTNSVGWFIIN